MNIVLHLESKDTEFVGCASKRVKKRVLGELMPMIVKLSLSAGALQTGGPGGTSTSGAQGAQQQRSPGLSLSVRPRKQGNMKLLLEPRGQQLTSQRSSHFHTLCKGPQTMHIQPLQTPTAC